MLSGVSGVCIMRGAGVASLRELIVVCALCSVIENGHDADASVLLLCEPFVKWCVLQMKKKFIVTGRAYVTGRGLGGRRLDWCFGS